ncbi:MAG: hypothetical protein Q9195_006734 [Heterodermia aff. obscurata]
MVSGVSLDLVILGSLKDHIAPEDIVLGPPKTAFASAAGPRSAKTFDSPSRGNFDDDVKADRPNFKDRFRDMTRGDRDSQKSKDDRPENTRNRDSERWTGARLSRTAFGEGDREFRRNVDREQGKEKENGKDIRGGRGFDSYRRNGDREGNGEERRHGQGRGRNEPSWYRDDDQQGDEESKDGPKRDWRDKVAGRGHDRDKSMGGNQEKEPEWLDEPDDKKQAHTLDDFQRWKEKMKASNGPVPETPTSPEPGPHHERSFSGTAVKKVETPLVVDSTFDAFFGNFAAKKHDSGTQGEEAAKVAVRASKFTGFFGAKAEPKPQEPPTPTASLPDFTKDRSSEDKEGFQRILKLLDQQQSSSSRNITPFREQTPRNVPQSPPPYPPQSPPPMIPDQIRESSRRETLSSSRPPKENAAFPSRDSEFLLNLMKQPQHQQPNRTPRTQPSQDDYLGQPTSVSAFSNLMISPRDTSQQTPSSGPPPGFFQHPSQPDQLQQQREKQPQPHHRQQPKPPAPPGFYDNLSKFFVDEQHNLPPGLQQRPPPPGVVDQHQSAQSFPPQRQQPPQPQSQQQQRQVQPPPGFQHMPTTHHQASFPPGLGMPAITSPHPNSNPSQQQQQFGARPPPPGFPNMNPNSFLQGGPPGFGNGGMYHPPQQQQQQDGYPPFGDFGGGVHYGR